MKHGLVVQPGIDMLVGGNERAGVAAAWYRA